MKIIFTKLVPSKKLAAVNLFGIVLAPKDAKISQRTMTHEAIHTHQMKEMFFLFFYLWYLVEWLIRLFGKGNAYHRIAFEREAYRHEHDKLYLKKRKPYNWVRYL